VLDLPSLDLCALPAPAVGSDQGCAQPVAMTLQLQVETTSVCQAACVWCPYPTTKRAKGFMTLALWRKIITEAAVMPERWHELCLTGLGEPLLDPHLDTRIAFARELLPELPIVVYTNGSYLTPGRFERLAAAGLSVLCVSLNAVRAEQRKQIMALEDYDAVLGYIDYAIAMGEPEVKVQVRAVGSPDTFPLQDMDTFYRRWGDARLGGHGLVTIEGNWAGDNRTVRPFAPNEACHRALGQLYVTWDGRVTPCCFIPDADVVCFGDLRRQSLREVYGSEEYVRFRQDHAADQADKHAFCARCTRI